MQAVPDLVESSTQVSLTRLSRDQFRLIPLEGTEHVVIRLGKAAQNTVKQCSTVGGEIPLLSAPSLKRILN
jgi:hypothetical protein